jgi:hypothetical protein
MLQGLSITAGNHWASEEMICFCGSLTAVFIKVWHWDPTLNQLQKVQILTQHISKIRYKTALTLRHQN